MALMRVSLFQDGEREIWKTQLSTWRIWSSWNKDKQSSLCNM